MTHPVQGGYLIRPYRGIPGIPGRRGALYMRPNQLPHPPGPVGAELSSASSAGGQAEDGGGQEQAGAGARRAGGGMPCGAALRRFTGRFRRYVRPAAGGADPGPDRGFPLGVHHGKIPPSAHCMPREGFLCAQPGISRYMATASSLRTVSATCRTSTFRVRWPN